MSDSPQPAGAPSDRRPALTRRLIAGTAAAIALAAAGAGAAHAAPGDIPGRGFLPDDRGWEKISPADKNGSDIYSKSGTLRASPDGNRVAFQSPVSFGGGAGAPVVSDHVADRTADGWSPANVSPRTASDLSGIMNVATGTPFGYQWYSRDLMRGIFMRSDDNVGLRSLYLRDFDGATEARLTPQPLATVNPISAINLAPMMADATDDGRRVLFESAQQLTPDAPEPTGAPQLYEWVDGDLRIAGVLPNGDVAPAAVAGASAGHAVSFGVYETSQMTWTSRTMSENGSRIVFTVPDDPSNFLVYRTGGEVYLREGGVTTHISASRRTDCADDANCGGDGQPDPVPDPDGLSGRVIYLGATPDASVVFFRSCRRLTDDAPEQACIQDPDQSNLYRYDVDSGDLKFLSIPGGIDFGAPMGISDDGSSIYFYMGTRIVGSVDGQGVHVGDSYGGDRVSNAEPIRGYMRQSRVSADGRFVLWVSPTPGSEKLPNGNPVLLQTVSLYDSESGEVVCVSCPADDSPVTGHSTPFGQNATSAPSAPDYAPRVMDDAGRWVFFQTAQALVPEDTNGKIDVYQYGVASGEHRLISSGKGNDNAHLGDVTPDGSSVFIVTGQRLVAADGDNEQDLYVARVGGGLPEPARPRQACEGDGCQDETSRGALSADPASDSFQGRGDVPSRPRAEFSIGRFSASARARAARTGRLRLAIRVNRPGLVKGVARARLGGSSVVVGRGSRRARKSGRVTVPLVLSRPARKRIATRNGLALSVSVRFAGASAPRTLSLDLRRPR